MKKENLTSTVWNAVLTAAVIAATVPFTDASWAQADLNNSVASLQTGISHIPQLVTGAFYIGGAALIGAGAMKLRAHAENPTNTPLAQCLSRIVAGTALMGIPAFSAWLNTTTGLGNNNFTEQNLGVLN